MNTESLIVEIWNRLRFGKSLDGLRLQMKNGRVDLTGFERPAPSVIRRYETPLASVAERDESQFVRGASWRNLDFTGACLDGLRLFDCEIHNCCFDACQFDDLRVWTSKLSECSFRKANLRRTVLGPLNEGKRNIYSHIDFSGADLRETVYIPAVFDHCLFRAAKLVRVDFGGSAFSDCVFEGKLDDVLFYHRGYGCEMFPPNEMINVDFSRVELRHVGFRGLLLDRVKLPNDAKHLVIKDFMVALDKIASSLASQPDEITRRILAFLENRRESAIPSQSQGVISLPDLAKVAGEEGVRRLLAVVPK